MSSEPRVAILNMIQAIERAQRLSSGLSEADLMPTESAQWAVFSQIVILGEAAGRLERHHEGKR